MDDAFNGAKQPQAGIPGLNFGGGGRGGANFFQQMMQQQAAQSTAKPRIRVVADPATNSLLVQASPLDMLEIRHLLDKAIDSNDTDSNAVIKTWKPIVLKNANASEVAATVSSVYREYMDAGASASFTNVGPNGISFATRNRRGNAVDANGNPRSVSLTIGLYANTNSIVLQCSETMYKEVKLLIDELDQAAKDSPSTVKLVRIRDVDPYLVQQALDAIQGRPVTSASGIPVSGGQGSGMGGPGAARMAVGAAPASLAVASRAGVAAPLVVVVAIPLVAAAAAALAAVAMPSVAAAVALAAAAEEPVEVAAAAAVLAVEAAADCNAVRALLPMEGRIFLSTGSRKTRSR